MVATEELSSLPLFASLDTAALAELAPFFEDKTVSDGVQLVGEGAPGYSFYVLAAGGCKASAGGVEVGHLGPGDFFGETAILTDGRRHATVTTTEPSKVLVMFGTEFRRLQVQHPDIADAIERAMLERMKSS